MPDGIHYASPWRRLMAWEIDALLIGVFSLGVTRLSSMAAKASGFSAYEWPLNLSLTGLVLLAYFSAFDASSWKGTPGKRWLSLRVTSKRGQQITLLNAASRTLLSWALAVLFGATFIASFFQRKHQMLHDLVLDTVVLERRDGQAKEESSKGWRRGEPIGVVVVSCLIAMGLLSAAMWPVAQVAQPVVAQHRQRNLIDRSIEEMAPLKQFIEEQYKVKKSMPPKVDTELLNSVAKKAGARVLYNPMNGVILIQYEESQYGRAPTVSLYPIPKFDGAFTWNCSTFAIAPDAVPPTCK